MLVVAASSVVARAGRALCLTNGAEQVCEALLGPSDWLTCARDAAQRGAP